MNRAAKSKRVDRTAVIRDPVQRAVAVRVGEVLDIFSERFAAIKPPESRLVAVPGAADAPGRVRNMVRPLAIGVLVKLLLDLGCPRSQVHGWADLCGATEIVELGPLHPHSVMQCRDTVAALIEDRGEFGQMVAARYDRLLSACRRDAAAFAREMEARAKAKTKAEREKTSRARARAGVVVAEHRRRRKAKPVRRPRSAAAKR